LRDVSNGEHLICRTQPHNLKILFGLLARFQTQSLLVVLSYRYFLTMTSPSVPQDLIVHLTQVTRLEAPEAARVLAEVCAYFHEPVETFVTRRHMELRNEGQTNIDIYARISEELEQRRFPAPVFSHRQIRRLIYG